MKPCKRCDEWLPLSAYYADSRLRDGRCSTCKDCMKEASREWHARNYVARNTMRQARDSFGRFYATRRSI
jgi:predicted RNA-binding protein with PUA-like domain